MDKGKGKPQAAKKPVEPSIDPFPRAVVESKPIELVEVEEGAEEATELGGVPASELLAGQEFEFEGNRYRVRANCTIALLEWDPSGTFRVEKLAGGIEPDSLVKPV